MRTAATVRWQPAVQSTKSTTQNAATIKILNDIRERWKTTVCISSSYNSCFRRRRRRCCWSFSLHLALTSSLKSNGKRFSCLTYFSMQSVLRLKIVRANDSVVIGLLHMFVLFPFFHLPFDVQIGRFCTISLYIYIYIIKLIYRKVLSWCTTSRSVWSKLIGFVSRFWIYITPLDSSSTRNTMLLL